MKTSAPSRPFTLAELLVALVVIATLGFLLAPAFTMARESVNRSRCVGNLRQIGVALHLYAEENAGQLPRNAGGGWPIDLQVTTARAFLATGAVEKEHFFCPASPTAAFNDDMWRFAVSVQAGVEVGGYRMTNYVLLLEGTPGVPFQMQNREIGTPPPLFGPGRNPTVTFLQESERELVVEKIIGTAANGFTVRGGGQWIDRPNHHGKTYPQGGNILYLDGHVAWRDFSEMQMRTFTPPFWW